MEELVCTSCMGNEFKRHKFGIQCKYCLTIFDWEPAVKDEIQGIAFPYSITSSYAYTPHSYGSAVYNPGYSASSPAIIRR